MQSVVYKEYPLKINLYEIIVNSLRKIYISIIALQTLWGYKISHSDGGFFKFKFSSLWIAELNLYELRQKRK